jgi:hypothetical protein
MSFEAPLSQFIIELLKRAIANSLTREEWID